MTLGAVGVAVAAAQALAGNAAPTTNTTVAGGQIVTTSQLPGPPPGDAAPTTNTTVAGGQIVTTGQLPGPPPGDAAPTTNTTVAGGQIVTTGQLPGPIAGKRSCAAAPFTPGNCDLGASASAG